MEERNVYLYWVGKEYKLISILRRLIYLHSTRGNGYKVNLITPQNIKKYIQHIPYFFNKLCPAHQADFVRVNVICDNGGIWLDSDTLVMDSLDSLFDILEKKDGFFIIENNKSLCNGVFGSKKNTPLMIHWKNKMVEILCKKKHNIYWTEIGSTILKNITSRFSDLLKSFEIINGLDNVYPVNWRQCVTEFIDKPYDNYKTIVRNYQPLIILVNSVYKKMETMTKEEFFSPSLPLNYFMNKSFSTAGLTDEVLKEEHAIETPLIEEHPIEMALIEEHQIETPLIEEQTIETPLIEEHPIETPLIEEHQIETPLIEEKTMETPLIEEQTIETDLIEEQTIETPLIEEHPIETPLIEEHPIETDLIEEQTIETPLIEERPIESDLIEEQL